MVKRFKPAKEALKLDFRHGRDSILEVFGIGERRGDEIIDDVIRTYLAETRVSRMVERLAEKYGGAEFVFALLTLGRCLGYDDAKAVEEAIYEEEHKPYIG